MGHAARQNAAGLAKKLSQVQSLNTHYLRAMAALLIERQGEIRIPASTFQLLDPEMVIKQDLDEESKEVVFRLIVPQEPTH